MTWLTRRERRSARRVPREAVVRAWLAREQGGSEPPATAAGAFDALLSENPGAAAFLWRDAPHTCYRLSLSRARFDRLHVVEGPPELGWGALSPDGTVESCARRIDRGDPDRLARTTGVDVPLIERLSEGIGPPDPLVLSTRRGAVPWHVADGNHRAVATALSLRRGASYEPIPAYLCVGANPAFGPLLQRVRGRFR